MNRALIFAKTAKGREEVEKRTHRIDAKRRVMLIMVDGASSAEQLLAKTAHVDDGVDILQSLWKEGFIEPAGAFAGASLEEQQEVPIAVPQGRSLKELQRLASHAIENLLGPEGETMALRLERTTTMEQFLAEAQRTRDTLQKFAGARKADAFWAALGL